MNIYIDFFIFYIFLADEDYILEKDPTIINEDDVNNHFDTIGFVMFDVMYGKYAFFGLCVLYLVFGFCYFYRGIFWLCCAKVPQILCCRKNPVRCCFGILLCQNSEGYMTNKFKWRRAFLFRFLIIFYFITHTAFMITKGAELTQDVSYNKEQMKRNRLFKVWDYISANYIIPIAFVSIVLIFFLTLIVDFIVILRTLCKEDINVCTFIARSFKIPAEAPSDEELDLEKLLLANGNLDVKEGAEEKESTYWKWSWIIKYILFMFYFFSTLPLKALGIAI